MATASISPRLSIKTIADHAADGFVRNLCTPHVAVASSRSRQSRMAMMFSFAREHTAELRSSA